MAKNKFFNYSKLGILKTSWFIDFFQSFRKPLINGIINHKTHSHKSTLTVSVNGIWYPLISFYPEMAFFPMRCVLRGFTSSTYKKYAYS